MLPVRCVAKNQEKLSFGSERRPRSVQKTKTEGLQKEKKKGMEKAVQPSGTQGACAPLDRVEPFF
jgi:hypothetical protein